MNNNLLTPIIKEKEEHYLGHRERMRTKLLEKGAEVFSDCELMEMVLMCAIPRRDVKPLAKELLTVFGSFAGVINALPEELLQIKGVGKTVISFFAIIKQSALALIKTEAFKEPVINDFTKLIDYCVAKMGRDKVESFRVLFLDTKLRLLADEIFSKGTVNQTLIFPREIIKEIVSRGASSIIMVHNHPSGDTQPSDADIVMTNNIIKALLPLDVELIDHIIVSKNGYTSFKSRGLLK